jgi:hypothetical protein
MRHTGREIGDYLHDPAVLSFYTSVQKRGRLDRYRFVMAFVVSGGGKTVFRRMYEITGRCSLSREHFSSLFLPEHVAEHYNTAVDTDQYDFYNIKPSPHLSEYDGRLIIDWGKANVVWFQSFSEERPKAVLEILPAGFFRPFDGFSSISLTRSELEFLFAHEDANLDWAGQLSRVAGIYLILDEGTGKQYIGSASGRRGVWGRWQSYFADPSGGNTLLRSEIESNPETYRRFRYSLLQVMPGNSVASDVLAQESLYKKMLGTRAHGLNLN